MLYDLLKQQSEDIDRLRELVIKKYLVPSPNTPSHADLASPPPAVEDPENSDINFNEHSSAQWEVSTPPSNYISTTSTQLESPTPSSIDSIQGEGLNDPKDKMISNRRQGRVSHTVKSNSVPIAASVTAIPKATLKATLQAQSCPTPLNEKIIVNNLPDPPGESINTTERQRLSNMKSEKAKAEKLLAEWNSKPISKWWASLELKGNLHHLAGLYNRGITSHERPNQNSRKAAGLGVITIDWGP